MAWIRSRHDELKIVIAEFAEAIKTADKEFTGARERLNLPQVESPITGQRMVKEAHMIGIREDTDRARVQLAQDLRRMADDVAKQVSKKRT